MGKKNLLTKGTHKYNTGRLSPFSSLVIHRCLVGDPSGKSYGDVAFVEQHSLQANILGEIFIIQIWHEHTDSNIDCVIIKPLSWWTGLNSTRWAKDWMAADFELLCGDGRRAPLSEWESCNLGAIPPNTIMTRPVLRARVYDFLMKSQVSSCDLFFL